MVKRISQMSDASHVKRLVDSVGLERASDILCATQGGVGSMVYRQRCTAVYDALAKCALEKQGKTVTSTLLMVKADDDKYELVTKFLAAVGVKFAQFKV